MKLTRIRVKNFLSLENIEVELGKLNVLVGPNASGKSNLVKALQLLANHAKQGIPHLPGYERFRDIAYNFNERADITIEIEGTINNRSIRYTLVLRVDNYIERAWVDNVTVLASDGRSPAKILYAQKGVLKSIARHRYKPYFGIGLYETVLKNLPTSAIEELSILANTLHSIVAHSFIPEYIRAVSPVDAEPVLGYHGENLARVLLHLYLEDREAFTNIEDVMRSLVPEIEEIIPHLKGTNVEIWLRVKRLPQPLKPHNISDGTLRLLAYVTALYSGASIAVFEEPENCIHPHLLETLIDLARKAPCQVIITTHSPYLLDHVKPEEVYVVEKPGTATIVRKLSRTKEVKAVKKLLKQGGTLGEAWYSGLIGGIPETSQS